MAGRKHSGKFRKPENIGGTDFSRVRKTDASETGAAPAISF